MVLFFYSLFIFSYCNAEIIFPENGATLNYRHVLFHWDQEPDAISYEIQVLDDSSNILLSTENLITTAHLDQETFDWNKNYFTRVRPFLLNGNYGDWSEVLSFSVGDSIPSSNLEVQIFNEEQTQDGLIMFSQLSPDFGIVIIDKFGNQVWNTEHAYINHWNESGQLFGMRQGRGVEVNFYDQTLWQTPLGTEVDAHEIKQIPNRNYMGISPENQLGPIPLGPWTETYQDLGFIADGETDEFLWRGTKIIEWDKEQDQEIWSWSPFDYFSMDDYDSLEGRWWSPINGSHYGMLYDWNHVNSFHFDSEDSMVYVSSRNLSRITKISYPSKEIVWNMGLPQEYGYGDENICTDLLFSCQHHIQMLDNGDLLFFDNGVLSELLLEDNNPISRIRRVSVIDNSYCETVWQYDLPPELYGYKWGSVQLLKNDNYFIYTHGTGHEQGSICTMLEVSPAGDLIWKASHTITGAVWYRAYKIPSIHPTAYSVMFNRYNSMTEDGEIFNRIILDDINESLSFTIYNQSGYDQPYEFILSDNSGWFSAIKDTVFLNSGSDSIFTYYPNIQGDSLSSLQLNVKPIYHDWHSTNLTYDIIRINGILGVSDKNLIPKDFLFHQNYPNPFNPSTTLRYELPQDVMVSIIIYDMMGRVVRNLVSSQQNAGYKSIQWDATNNQGQPISAGLYLYKIQAGDFSQTKKMVLLK